MTYTGAGSGSGFTPLTYTYTYDSRGNILTISDPISGNRSYEYDALGQMTKETIGGTTYTYTYDTVGNLTSYDGVTLSYTDSVWQDRLTEVTINLQIFDPEDGLIPYDGGLLDGDIIVDEEIDIIGVGAQVYDEVGNPTSYANGTNRWNFTWDGRELKTAVPEGIGNSVSYTYDENGLRTTKTVGDTTHTYFYAADGTLIRETRSNGDTMEFLYDHAGQPYALILNGTVYYYVVNLQGDVVRIVDADGNTVVSYVYNAWGKPLSVTTNIPNTGIATAAISNPTISNAEIVAKMNPLRYRGYYYDTDTQLYYLQSRYYDPNLGRFINADSYSSTGQGILGNNMYAYCGNNPIARADTSGNFFFTILGAAIGAVTGYFDSLIMGTDPITGLNAGLVSGAIAGAGVDIGVLVTAGTSGAGIGAGLAIAGAFGAVGSAVGTGISTNWEASGSDYLGSAIVGAGMNMISFGLAPINGEIPKAGIKYMTDALMYEGQRCLTENVVAGSIVAVATTWTIRVGSSPQTANQSKAFVNMVY